MNGGGKQARENERIRLRNLREKRETERACQEVLE